PVTIVLRDVAAHAAADGDADAVALVFGHLESRLCTRFARRHDRKLCEAIQQLAFGLLEVVLGAEARNFSGGLGDVAGGVESGDAANAALSCGEAFPEGG